MVPVSVRATEGGYSTILILRASNENDGGNNDARITKYFLFDYPHHNEDQHKLI